MIPFWILGVAGASGFLLNLFGIIWFVVGQKFKRSPPDAIVFSLSFADAIYSLGVLFLTLWFYEVVQIHHDTFLLMWQVMQGTCVSATLIHILFITIDRFIAVKLARLHHSYMRGYRPLFALIVIWVASGIVASTQHWLTLDVIDFCISTVIVCAFVVAMVTYGFICHKLQRGTIHGSPNDALNARIRKVMMMCCVITVTFFACNMPFAVLSLYYFVLDMEWTIIHTQTVYFLIEINCIADPIIYVIIGRLIPRNYRRDIPPIVPPEPSSLPLQVSTTGSRPFFNILQNHHWRRMQSAESRVSDTVEQQNLEMSIF